MNLFMKYYFSKGKPVHPAPDNAVLSRGHGGLAFGVIILHFLGKWNCCEDSWVFWFSTPLVMVELNALPEPLCVFCLVGIIFLWEAQCWWFVYFTYFHRFLNNLVRWTRWLYYTYCKYCFIFTFEFILCLLCVLCLQLRRCDHLGVWGEAGGWHKESSLIAHFVLWDRVSHWSWSLLFCLDWLAREPPVLGLYMCTPMPRFTWILQRKLMSSFHPTPNFWFK